MGDRKRVWIYCRTAHPDAAELEMQRTELKMYARKKHYKIVGITSEHGSGLIYDRPGMHEILEAVEDGGMDILLVRGISRLGRNIVKTYHCLRWLSDRQVEVVCADGTAPQPLMETIPYLMTIPQTVSYIKNGHT